jgi:hypothetical protein
VANSPTKTIRVKPGSALERLTSQKPDFTAAVHQIAEVLELAMAEEAARNLGTQGLSADYSVETRPRSDRDTIYRFDTETGQLTKKEGDGITAEIEISPRLNGDGTLDVGPHYRGVAIRQVDSLEDVEEPRAPDQMSDDEVLEAYRDQLPAGLVPVRVIHDDEDPDGEPTSETDVEDLSELI